MFRFLTWYTAELLWKEDIWLFFGEIDWGLGFIFVSTALWREHFFDNSRCFLWTQTGLSKLDMLFIRHGKWQSSRFRNPWRLSSVHRWLLYSFPILIAPPYRCFILSLRRASCWKDLLLLWDQLHLLLLHLVDLPSLSGPLHRDHFQTLSQQFLVYW